MDARAWQQSRYGDSSVLELVRIEHPRARRGEVVVAPRAVSVNSGDVHLLTGEPRLIRLFLGLRGPRMRVRGMDVAGVVTEVGEGVEDLQVGDRVVGEATATFATAVRVSAARLVPLPDRVGFREAAALPLAGGDRHARMGPGWHRPRRSRAGGRSIRRGGFLRRLSCSRTWR